MPALLTERDVLDYVNPSGEPLLDVSYGGATTTMASMHFIRSATATTSSSILATRSSVPVWISAVLEDVRRFDLESVLSSQSISRLVQAIIALPAQMPKPEVGVGGDGTVGLEWDLRMVGQHDAVGIEVYVSNFPDEDAFIISGGEIADAPLFQALPKVVPVLERILNSYRAAL